LRQFLSCKGNYQRHKTDEREFIHAKSIFWKILKSCTL
jgi:hypothetical protein